MPVTSTYTTGTASINAGETVVTGQGTTWKTAGLRAGDRFWAAGLSVRIAADPVDETHLTLAYPWPGATRTAQTYEISYTPDAERVLASTRKMLAALAAEALTPLADLTPAANKIAYYAGVAVAALTDFTAFGRQLVGATDNAALRSLTGVREVLTANRTYYVRSDGNDANTGLANSAAGAFKTVMKAVNIVADTIDLGAYNVTIQVADGTYPEVVVLRPVVGRGFVSIVGNTASPANVVISPAAGDCISATNCGQWALDGVKLTTLGTGRAIASLGMCSITLRRIDFGSVGGAQHILATDGARVYADGTTLTISGGTSYECWSVARGAVLQMFSTAITVATSFSVTRFASAVMAGVVNSGSVTFSLGPNVITGTRYAAERAGGIMTSGGGVNYFPGTSAGVTTSPGWYA